MDSNVLKVISEDFWEPMNDMGEQWLPVLSNNKTIMGITRAGSLVLKKGGIVNRITNANTVQCLVFLECSPRDLVDSVNSRFGDAVGQKIIEQLQLADIVRAGLAQGSDYWATLALSWCLQLRCGSLLISELKKVQSAKWASQKTRQMAKRLLPKDE